MKSTTSFATTLIASALGLALFSQPARADDDLAAAAQNPIASMISLPIDTSYDFGADNGSAIISNIQPVIPVTIGEINLVSRFILPVAYVEGAIGGLPSIPELPPGTSESLYGISDLNYTGFFSPAAAGSVIWGVGPSVMFPTASDPLLGAEKWSAGPSMVVLTQPKPWSLGLLARQLWSFEGASDRNDVNQTMLQYFVNYNLDGGWYLMTDPVILANWQAPSDNRWTIPLGGGIGRIFTVGDQPLNVRLRSYYNFERPDGAPEWSINFSIAFLFPK